MAEYTPARLRALFTLADAFEEAAVALAREMRKRQKSIKRSRGATLRPGVDTPLWNAVISAAQPHLRRRGDKALLARELALDPARVTEFFVTRRAMPDAERTLELLVWLSQRAAREPAPKK